MRGRRANAFLSARSIFATIVFYHFCLPSLLLGFFAWRPPTRSPSSAYSGTKGAVGSRPGSGSARPGSASSSVRSFFNGRTQPVPGPPAWWLGSGRESPATGLAGREAKHTAKYQAFARRAELLLASIDESVQRSTVATHIQGRTQMIDVATFWDAWEGEIPPQGAMPEWRPFSGPFLNAGRVHPNSLPLSFRIVIRNRTQRTVRSRSRNDQCHATHLTAWRGVCV